MAESVVKGTLKYSISTWINLIVGFLSVIITTRIINPEDYGMVSLFFSASSVFIYILSFGMDGALIRFYNEPPNNNTVNQLLYKILLLSFIISCTIGLFIFTFLSSWLSDKIFGVESRLIIVLLFIYTIVQIILRYLNISFRMGFKVKMYTIQNVLINCLSRGLIIVAAIISNNYIFLCSILTVGLFITLLVYLFLQKNEILPYGKDGVLNWNLDFRGYSSFFKFATFSAPTYIIVYLNTLLSQQIINVELGVHLLGVFASTTMFVTILSAVQSGFSTFWSAFVYKNYNIEKKRIVMMHDYVVLFSILMSCILVCFRDFVYLFIGTEYHSSKIFYTLILISPILNFISETTAKGITIMKKNHISLFINIIGVIVNIGLCLYLIPKYSIVGAAIANAASALSLYTMNTIVGQKYYRSINSITKSIVGIMFVIAILLLPLIISNHIFSSCIAVLCVLISFLVYKNEINLILTFIDIKKHLRS